MTKTQEAEVKKLDIQVEEFKVEIEALKKQLIETNEMKFKVQGALEYVVQQAQKALLKKSELEKPIEKKASK